MLATVRDPDSGRTRPERALETARRAEAAGFDGVHVGDHLAHPHPMLESIVTLSAVAAVTERVALGPYVLLMGLRSPSWLAKQIGTLASLAPGRLRIGVGVGGEYPGEFEAAGVPFAERGRRTEAVVVEVRALLRDGLGRSDVTIAPGAPDVPFLFAGWREVALRRAARLGDGWVGYLLGPESFARRRELLMSCREELGTSGAPFTTGMLVPVHVDDSSRARERGAAAWAALTDAEANLPDHLVVAGSPDEVAERLHRYWELGCTEIVLGPADQGEGYSEQVERLATEVLPRLRRFT